MNNRHIIKDSERGHRAPLSKKEPSVCMGLTVLVSVKKRMEQYSTDQRREIIELGLDEYGKRIV